MRQQKKMIVSYDGPQTLSVTNNCSTTSGTAMDVSTNQSIDSIYSRGVSSTVIASGYGTNSMSIYGYTRLSRSGRAIGVWGAGSVLSNSSSQSNAFGVVGGFGYTNRAKGAGIYGTSTANILQLNQKYAGYFYGPVEVQGNLTVTGNINGVLLSPPASSVSSRSVFQNDSEDGSLAERFSNLVTQAYYYERPEIHISSVIGPAESNEEIE